MGWLVFGFPERLHLHAAGHLPQRANEAEVGVGLADALGLHPGSVLAAQLPDGTKLVTVHHPIP